MSDKPKCSKCNERDASHKGLCSRCYAKKWREKRNVERAVESIPVVEPKQLTAGVIEGEIVHDDEQVKTPDTHLVATSPVEMAASRDDLKAWLEQRLSVLERDIIEANAALNEARKHGWSTAALTSARNRAVDDETFYYKILMAVETGYTIIPDFPIQVFAIRREDGPQRQTLTYTGLHNGRDTGLGQPVPPDYAPAGVGDFRNPLPSTWTDTRENSLATPENKQPRYYTTVTRFNHPAAPISFPQVSARSPVMRATAKAMKEKVFDQIGVCLPTTEVAGGRAVQRGTRAGDPLIIGQVVRKRVGSQQKVVSFIIAWHLNLDEL